MDHVNCFYTDLEDYYINRNLLEANGAQSLSISTSPEFQSVYTDLEYINRNLLEANGAQSLSLPVFSSPEFRRVSIHTVRTDALDRLFEFVEEKISQNRANKNQH